MCGRRGDAHIKPQIWRRRDQGPIAGMIRQWFPATGRMRSIINRVPDRLDRQCGSDGVMGCCTVIFRAVTCCSHVQHPLCCHAENMRDRRTLRSTTRCRLRMAHRVEDRQDQDAMCNHQAIPSQPPTPNSDFQHASWSVACWLCALLRAEFPESRVVEVAR